MDALQRIQAVVDAHAMVLFMKGTPQFPMCGFSARAAQCLKNAGASFHSVNVLEDPEIRANLPQFANWKTFPQLFVHGELIGGSDIVADLEASGELKRIVEEAQAQARAA